MTNDNTKTEEAAGLWHKAREDRTEMSEAPEALLLAAYLDGRLGEAEAARLEARLAGDAELLDEMLALRRGLAAGPEAAPAALVARAQALRPAARVAVAEGPSWLARFLGEFGGVWLRPAVPAFAGLALLLASAGAFELGRFQAGQLNAPQSAEVAESDIPVDLLMDDLI